MKNLIVTAILIVLSAPVFAQIPENWKLEKAEDYAMYEDDVINCIDWLADTPLLFCAPHRRPKKRHLIIRQLRFKKFDFGCPVVNLGHVCTKKEEQKWHGQYPDNIQSQG